jgi:Trk-type K+ transport system membrane component
MPITTVLILVGIGLVLFGGIGFLAYCDISSQKMRKTEKEAAKNKK